MADELRASLRDLFGHEDFRPGQREIVESTLAGRDTLAVLPTGGGKSITYQLPAMLLPGITLVLSPLIALMKDQAEGLPPAVAERTVLINSSLEFAEVGRRMGAIRSGRIRLVYAAPERLRQPPFLHLLRRAGVSLLVVDEAHCISQWGHDFRPDYRAVGRAVEFLAPKTVLAVTATAPPDVQADIERQLGRPLQRLIRPTWRENLFLTCRKVRTEDDKLWATLEMSQSTEGSGLVYATSREKCEQIARMLRRQGVAAGFYHAGLPPDERAAAQDRFMAGDVRVMAATVAFGMGVDKRDIRFLLHYHPSRSLENYYQEAGRAGRDGTRSFCTLLWSPGDAASSTRRQNEDTLSVESVRRVYAAVRSALGRRLCGRVPWEAVTAGVGGDDGLVRAALPVLEEVGLLRRHADLPRRLVVTPDALEADASPSPAWTAFAEALRVGSDFDPIDLSRETGVPLPELEATVLELQDAGHVTYRAQGRDPLIELLPPPEEVKARLQALLTHRAAGSAARAAAMMAYCREETCRHKQIARYFGDRWPHRRCGGCDLCAPREAPRPHPGETAPPSSAGEEDPACALRLVADLAAGRSAFALGKAGLVRALRGTPDAPIAPARSGAFGAFAGWKKAEVERLLEALVEQDYLWRDDADEYRRLHLTDSGKAALRDGSLDIAWRLPARAAAAAERPADVDLSLLATLREWRRETADAANAPAYVVFADRVLEAIAARRPANEFDLLAIPGIGPAKAARYGATVLDLVRQAGEK